MHKHHQKKYNYIILKRASTQILLVANWPFLLVESKALEQFTEHKAQVSSLEMVQEDLGSSRVYKLI